MFSFLTRQYFQHENVTLNWFELWESVDFNNIVLIYNTNNPQQKISKQKKPFFVVVYAPLFLLPTIWILGIVDCVRFCSELIFLMELVFEIKIY